jgi:hypothetical protein
MLDCEKRYKAAGWNYMRWSLTQIEHNNPIQFIHKDLLLHSTLSTSEKVSIARYEILYHYGGLFVDESLRCVTDLASHVSLERGGDSLILFNFPIATPFTEEFFDNYLALASVQYSDIALAFVYHVQDRRFGYHNTTHNSSRYIHSVLSRFNLRHNILTKEAQLIFQKT